MMKPLTRRDFLKASAAGGSTLALSLALTGCGSSSSSSQSSGSSETETAQTTTDTETTQTLDENISEDSPYQGLGLDLSEHATVVMYAIGDKPEDMDMVMEEVNTNYLEPWLNTTLEVKFLTWSDYGTKYSLLLTGGEQVDLIYTASWCYYNAEVSNGAFLALSDEFLQTYLPISYELQASESWDQAMVSNVIYAIPKNNASFNNYNVIAFRSDLMEKYDIAEINSWDSMKEALYTIADNESVNGIFASGQRGNGEYADHLWWQKIETEPLASGYAFMYYTHGSEDLPDWDEDVFYRYDSQAYLDFCLEMAEMADRGVWSANKINDSTEAAANFVSGKVASLVWNSSVVDYGQEMEEAGNGTFEIFDVTPDMKAARGSYADDMMAIPASSSQPERAALVLDALKGFDELNNLVVGGMEGVHYTLDEDGKRSTTDSSDRYNWGGWAWGITGKNSPGLASDDERDYQFGEICESKEYAPVAAGFTFDSSSVETEMALVNAIVEEYQSSFNLGMFGDNTEGKYEEFVGKLHDAGLDTVMEECRTQYEAFRERKEA